MVEECADELAMRIAEICQAGRLADEVPELPEAVEHEGAEGLDCDGIADAADTTQAHGFSVAMGS